MHQNPTPWTGRMDGESEEHLRWHQIVKYEIGVEKDFFGILGFACDEGVKRNKGRVGAKNGPKALRQFCANFPANHQNIIDLGDVVCEDTHLENAQNTLAAKVNEILLAGGKSIVFGGGHEVLFGHYSGIRNTFPDKKIGIINFDAHFDNRAIDPEIGASSGTGFWQIAQQDANYQYLAIGIQKNANTKALFNFADTHNTITILGEEFIPENKTKIETQIDEFLSQIDVLYVTVCLDVFAAAFAPGVSAPAYSGIFPDAFFRSIFNKIVHSPKLKSFDIAELNPAFDIDNHTARLAASLVFEVVS